MNMCTQQKGEPSVLFISETEAKKKYVQVYALKANPVKQLVITCIYLRST